MLASMPGGAATVGSNPAALPCWNPGGLAACPVTVVVLVATILAVVAALAMAASSLMLDMMQDDGSTFPVGDCERERSTTDL